MSLSSTGSRGVRRAAQIHCADGSQAKPCREETAPSEAAGLR
ncbi:hypothetical protein [Nocardioides terrisoli]|nr:hypothetical protein [Nocardioides marmorisolisilvae]